MPSTKPNKRLQPKQRFIAEGATGGPSGQSESARWADRTDDPTFQAHCERALAEYVVRQKAVDLTSASVAGLKVEGAKEVLNILLNLGEPDQPVVKRAEDQLTPI